MDGIYNPGSDAKILAAAQHGSELIKRGLRHIRCRKPLKQMECPFCEHPKAHKHGQTSKGSKRYKCPKCRETFTETLGTIYYRRRVPAEQIETILQCHAEGTSLRGISRVSHRAYETVVSIVNAASQKAQQIHNEEVKEVDSEAIVAARIGLYAC